VQQLHWALPRPTSKAEQQMVEQLEVGEVGGGGGAQSVRSMWLLFSVCSDGNNRDKDNAIGTWE
jgi:hypothetical protein